jgi:hypothetical protein
MPSRLPLRDCHRKLMSEREQDRHHVYPLLERQPEERRCCSIQPTRQYISDTADPSDMDYGEREPGLHRVFPLLARRMKRDVADPASSAAAGLATRMTVREGDVWVTTATQAA